MKSVPRSRQTMHPNSELIATVQKSASEIVEHQMTRDRERFQFEKQKLGLLIVLILSLWVMFFFLCDKLDELRPNGAAPAGENNTSTPLADPTTQPDRDQGESSQFHYVI